jgi:poly(A) polymerase
MTLEPLHALKENGLRRLMAATRAAGGELRLVGGAVRDQLLGRAVTELDAATTLEPDAMQQAAEAGGFRVVPTGIDHGTLTIILPERAIEVTSLRRDETCDGRYATVAYTTDWREDAARRDFTINALYMDGTGEIYDYHGGIQDIAAGHLRFIGDANLRIEEDGLRILRFFRFLATHARPPVDAAALAACRRHRPMLASLSGERIAQEMRKILAAADPLFALQQFCEAGIDEALFGNRLELAALPLLLAIEQRETLAPDPWVRLIILLPMAVATPLAEAIAGRWKLSNREREILRLLTSSPLLLEEDALLTHQKFLRRYGLEHYQRLLLLSGAHGVIAAIGEKLAWAKAWQVPRFPVTSQMLMARGLSGKALGDALRRLEAAWEESGYTASAEALVSRI